MNEDTTIIIPTKNNQEEIIITIKEISEHMDKNRNIKQIIITDNASSDETLPRLIHELNRIKDERILLITQPTQTTRKKTLIVALEQAGTPLTIIIEPELNTRLHQIRHQIKKLRKCDIVLPNRYHKNSKTKWQGNNEIKNRNHNRLIKKILRIPYDDTTHINKAFKTKKMLDLLDKTTSEKYYWQEGLILATKKDMKISQTRTHWIEEKTETQNKISFLKSIKELIRIRSLKK